MAYKTRIGIYMEEEIYIKIKDYLDKYHHGASVSGYLTSLAITDMKKRR